MTVFTKVQGLVVWALLSSLLIHAQERKWPVQYRTRMDNGAPIKEGYIVLKNEDTLRGFIKVLPITNSYPILDTGNNQLCDIDVKDISMMRLYDISTAGPYNDFFNLGYKHFLWRLIGKKGDISMYDDELKSGILQITIFTPTKKIRLYSKWTWFIYNSNIDRMLVHFINRRYKVRVSEDDFKSTSDMYQYILDKESAFLNAPLPGKFSSLQTAPHK
jgi:hypothetical protein